MPKAIFHEHVGSYAAIPKRAPQGLHCLKVLLSQYDIETPNRMVLNDLLAPGFQDTENGSERTVNREEAIEAILGSRAQCIKHQFDLKHAYCIEHSGAHHTVFFESVRFMLLHGNTDYIRVPVAGRIEVKITENRFKMKDAVASITARNMTHDQTQLARRGLVKSPSVSTALNPADLGDMKFNYSTSQVDVPRVPELPAPISPPAEEKPLPVYRNFGSSSGGVTRTPTVTSGTGSSVDAEQGTKASWN